LGTQEGGVPMLGCPMCIWEMDMSKPKLATVKAKLKNLATLAFFVIVTAGSLYHGIDGLMSESVRILPRDGGVYHIYWSEEPIWCTYAVIVWLVLSAIGVVGLYFFGLNWYYARNARLRQRATRK
jgi:hypothetical protein